MTPDIIQSLWIGGPLSAMERLAIQSFVDSGHIFHLYCYDRVEGVPPGAVVRDANEILPAHRIFGYADGFAKGSVAAFSNFFRYKLLLERGGWWVDADVVCVRRFGFQDDRLWAAERLDPPGELIVATSVIKAPPGDPVIAWAWNACERLDPNRVVWGDVGPQLLQAAVTALDAHAFMRPHTFFSPIPHFEWQRLLTADEAPLPPETYTVHLWNQRWSAAALDKNGSFPPECLYERLKRRFLRP